MSKHGKLHYYLNKFGGKSQYLTWDTRPEVYVGYLIFSNLSQRKTKKVCSLSADTTPMSPQLSATEKEYLGKLKLDPSAYDTHPTWSAITQTIVTG